MSDARTIARRVADDLVVAGADAVVLGGSVVRGDEHPGSDIDLCALGDGPSYSLRIVDDRLVSVSWRQSVGVLELLDSPPDAGGAVPAWRRAEILVDLRGRAALLQRFAQEWRWARIDSACDAWVADTLPGYVEEVFRLCGLLAVGRAVPAAVIRSVLALRLPQILAVHRRLLYDSENELWGLVAEALAETWGTDHQAALGIGVDPKSACRAALRLWIRAVVECRDALTANDRQIVDAAVTMARRVTE